jgi:hypothetical protein
MNDLVYPYPNRRKCYWLVQECLRGHNKCSTRCADYMSVAEAEREKRIKLGLKRR